MWSARQLERIEGADELLIAVERSDGTLRRWVPIWVVCADGQVYVRTWYRRDTGWFGQILKSRRARIRVSEMEISVTVEDVGDDPDDDLRAGVDRAYRAKYGRHGGTSVAGMVTDSAATTTLRLIPEAAHQA